MAADYMVHDGVAVIMLNHPPVNGLDHATRAGVMEGLERAAQDAAVTAIVLIGAGRVFSGGADITEFNTAKAVQEPTLATVIRAVEASTKPVVAALAGVALGGGLELALGAHYRIATPAVRIALPEVKLGLMPGAGGTQRLPRAVGLETALAMIVSGTSVEGRQLAATGMFDALAATDLAESAQAFARRVGAAAGPHPRVRERAIVHDDAAAVLQAARRDAQASAPHYPAPQQCIDAIETGLLHGFDAGLARERAGFVALLQTPQSHALRHIFFGERAAGKIADVRRDTPVRDLQTVAVVGAGMMGTGIAMSFADAGLPVILFASRRPTLDRALAAIRARYQKQVEKGRLTPDALRTRLESISPTLDDTVLGEADLVVEAVVEEIDVKEQVLRRLDAVMKPGAILATNTSTLDVNRLAAFTNRPQDVLGMHFFSPAQVMKLLEVVRGEATSKTTLATVLHLAKRIGKVAVVAGVCDGFIGNRMIEPAIRQALCMLEEGALPAQIDRALEHFGWAMGPFRMSDLVGNDVGWVIRKRRYAEHSAGYYPRIADQLCELGRLGQKVRAGWYDYAPDGRGAQPAALVDEMIIAGSQARGLVRRTISDDEIIERYLFALINEGAKILAEKIASKASDIDVMYVTGYGFPRWRGGPLYYADTVGLDHVVRALQRYAQGPNGATGQIAPWLAELAQRGGSFTEAGAQRAGRHQELDYASR